MAIVISYKGYTPRIDPDAWVAPTATIIGDVHIAKGVSVWFGCVLRGDVGPIRVGEGTNLQDMCLVHTTGGVSRAIIGANVTVGHRCVLHGCEIGDGVLVGMTSVLLDNAVVGEHSVIGAGSLVTQRMVFAPGSLVLGRPAKRVRDVTEDERRMGDKGAAEYRKLMMQYRLEQPR